MKAQAGSLTDRRYFAVMLSTLLGVILAMVTGHMVLMVIGPLILLFLSGLIQIRLIYFLLLFSIPFSAELQVTDSLGTDFPDEPFMWLLSLVLLLHFMLYKEKIGETKIHPGLFRILLIHLAWIALCSLLSEYPLLSMKYFAAKSWYLLAFSLGTWYCIRSWDDLLKAGTLLILAMIPVVIIIVLQHFQTGFTFDTVNDSVQPFFRNHVNYGAFLVCMLPVVAAAYLLSPRYRPVFFFILLFFLLALFLSYSRGAWLAGITGVITVLAMRYRRLVMFSVFTFMLIVFALLFFSSGNRYLNYRPDFEHTIYHQQFSDHLKATYRLTDLSTAERFHRWIGGFRMTKGHHLHGYGPNSFYYEYKPYTVSAFQTYVSENKERSTVHNYFLLLWIEQGIPGLIIFLLLLGLVFYRVSQWYHHATSFSDKVVAASITAILGMIVTLNMLSDLIETDKIGGLFFICVGLLCKMPFASKQPAPDQ